MGKDYGRIEKYDFHALKSTGTATGNNRVVYYYNRSLSIVLHDELPIVTGTSSRPLKDDALLRDLIAEKNEI